MSRAALQLGRWIASACLLPLLMTGGAAAAAAGRAAVT